MHCLALGAGASALPQGSLGQSPSSLTLGSVSGYTQKKESCIQAPWGRDASFVVPPHLSCNLWPQVPSLSRLQGDGQGIPCPHFPPPRYTAHIQVHHHLEHTALPARVKTQSGGLQFKWKQCQRLRAEGTGPHLQAPSGCLPSDVTFLPTQRGDDVTRQMSSELLRTPDAQDWIQ